MKRTLHGMLVLIAVCLLNVPHAFAQVDRATLTGIVKDPSDAVIPGAQVTVTGLANGAVTKVTTNVEGTYLALNLTPGEYLVQIEALGFQKYEQTVALATGTRARLDISMALGALGEMVTVAGVTPLLSTESAVLGTVVAQRRSVEAAAGDPQLGRPARDGSRRSERSLHRAGRRYVGRPHRRRQRARQPQPTEQLPPRRRREQQLLHERAGTDDADLAAVGGCDSGVQGRDEPVRGGVRLVAGRCGHRQHEIGDELDPRNGVRVLPQHRPGHDQLLRQVGEPAESRPTSRTSSAAMSADRSNATSCSSSGTTRAHASSRACCVPAGC